MYTHICKLIHTCSYTYICTYIHTYVHTIIFVHIWVELPVCNPKPTLHILHTYIQIWIHTYVHTYMYTFEIPVCNLQLTTSLFQLLSRIFTILSHCCYLIYERHKSFICETWLIHMWKRIHPSFSCCCVYSPSSRIAAPYFMWDKHIHMCDMTHSCMRHDAFMYETWLIHMWDMTHRSSSCSRLYSPSSRIAAPYHIWRGHD